MSGILLSSVLSGQFGEWLLSGLLLSIQLTLATLLCSLPLATGIWLCRLSPWLALSAAGLAFVEVVRNIPLLAHLLFWYFAAPELLPLPAREWLYAHHAETLCAFVALTLYTAAYMSEDLRSGTRAVPAAQLEAGRSLGLSYLASMRRIVLPQALRVSVPPLISQTLNLWKNTSIATVIGTAELMYQAQRVESASFLGVETFLVATVAYLSISLLISGLSAWYEHGHTSRTT